MATSKNKHLPLGETLESKRQTERYFAPRRDRAPVCWGFVIRVKMSGAGWFRSSTGLWWFESGCSA